MDTLKGHTLGRYHILEQLGEGGMAVVYKAYDTHLEHEVAVKVIRLDNLPRNAEERALKRFEREAKAVARLDHANIVKVTDYGEHEGSPYLVMPYLPGGTLKQYLKEHGSMDWREATRMLKPVAEALAYAHEQGLIHRDVKPSNILLTTRGEPMLTDFGVAKVVDDEVTQDLTGTSATVGTPEYMAPEQVVSKSVDQRADIYALGVVYYEMVTGRRPYEADTPMAVLFKHASAPLPRPKDLVPDLPDVVEQVLLKALAKRPEDRYQDMAAFTEALEGLERDDEATIVESASSHNKKLSPNPLTTDTKDVVFSAETPIIEITTSQKKKLTGWKAGGFISLLVLAVASIILILMTFQQKNHQIIDNGNVQAGEYSTEETNQNSTSLQGTNGNLETSIPAKKGNKTPTITAEDLKDTTLIDSKILSAQEVFPGETKAIRWLGSVGFIGDFSQPSDLFIQCLTCEDSAEQQVTFTGDYYTPSWSPEGNMIVAIKLNPNEWDPKLVIMDANGTWIEELKAHNPEFNYVNWSPNGEEIAYGTEDGELWVINVLTNETYMVLSKEQIETNFRLDEISWSPDGESLLFLTSIGERDCGTIWVVKPDGSDLVRLDSPSGYCIMSAAWSVKQEIAFSWIPITDSEFGEEESLVMKSDSMLYEKLEEAIVINSDLYYPQYITCGPGYDPCSATQ